MTPIEWLQHELAYSTTKHGPYRPDHDAHLKETGAALDGFWAGEIMGYMKRASVLGLDSPLGRQAAAKGFAVYEAMLESIERVYGPLPEPGHPSGEIL